MKNTAYLTITTKEGEVFTKTVHITAWYDVKNTITVWKKLYEGCSIVVSEKE